MKRHGLRRHTAATTRPCSMPGTRISCKRRAAHQLGRNVDARNAAADNAVVGRIFQARDGVQLAARCARRQQFAEGEAEGGVVAGVPSRRAPSARWLAPSARRLRNKPRARLRSRVAQRVGVDLIDALAMVAPWSARGRYRPASCAPAPAARQFLPPDLRQRGLDAGAEIDVAFSAVTLPSSQIAISISGPSAGLPATSAG